MVRTGGERGFVTVDGRRVLVRRFGTGPAVMVIHGSPQSSRAVEAVCQAIAARGLTAIAPDTPGAGPSCCYPRPSRPWRFRRGLVR